MFPEIIKSLDLPNERTIIVETTDKKYTFTNVKPKDFSFLNGFNVADAEGLLTLCIEYEKWNSESK